MLDPWLTTPLSTAKQPQGELPRVVHVGEPLERTPETLPKVIRQPSFCVLQKREKGVCEGSKGDHKEKHHAFFFCSFSQSRNPSFSTRLGHSIGSSFRAVKPGMDVGGDVIVNGYLILEMDS